MSPDEVPVAESETLYRVVDSDAGKWDFAVRQPRGGAFMPAGGDDDGISVFRARSEGHAAGFFTPEGLLAAQNNPSVMEYGGIVSVIVSEVTSVTSALTGFVPLTVEAAPDVLPGHALIPQINRVMSQDKTVGRKLAKDLTARLAARSLIQIEPTPKPKAI